MPTRAPLCALPTAHKQQGVSESGNAPFPPRTCASLHVVAFNHTHCRLPNINLVDCIMQVGTHIGNPGAISCQINQWDRPNTNTSHIRDNVLCTHRAYPYPQRHIQLCVYQLRHAHIYTPHALHHYWANVPHPIHIHTYIQSHTHTYYQYA